MSLAGFFMRWLFALLLVLVTFNPTGYSVSHWLWPWTTTQLPLKILVIMLLLACYLFFVSATVKSLGFLGIILVLGIGSTLIWLFVDQGWLAMADTGIMAWLLIVLISILLGLGISWSHIKKRITGQFDTDDVGE